MALRFASQVRNAILATILLVSSTAIDAMSESLGGSFETSACAATDAALYQPREEDFRPSYDRDKANAERQSWKEYWDWIESFYRGNAFDAGWTKRSQALFENLGTEEARGEIRAGPNTLGRTISAEWAKDNGVRKIDTNELRSFAKRLQDAKKKDDGTGQTLQAEIEAVRADVARELTK